MGMKQAILAVVLTVVLAELAWADFEDGLAAYYFRNYAAALSEWQPLAEQGHGKAQNNLGVMYAKGRGVTQDFMEAVKWYRLSAEQGYATAQYNLGLMYYTSQGVTQDYAEAAKWYRKAAGQGHTKAQLNLGFMYERAKGVPHDYVQAYMWLNLAAVGASAGEDRDAAIRVRDIIEKRMSLAEVTKAQRLAHEWLEKHQKAD
jgi:TPR repeat protein